MAHVMAAYDVGAVGQTARVPVVGRAQQQRGRVDGAARNHDHIRGVGFLAAVRARQRTLVTSRPDGVCFQTLHQ